MASLNKVLLIGNLTRDPELRYTPGGAAVAEFGMAINRTYTTSSNEKKEEVCFLDVVVWGKSAEACDKYLQKGAPLFVEGRIQMDQWTDKETQKQRSKLKIVAERTQFIGAPRGGGDFQQNDDGNSGYGGKSSGYGGQPQQQPTTPAAAPTTPPAQPYNAYGTSGNNGGGYQQPAAPAAPMAQPPSFAPAPAPTAAPTAAPVAAAPPTPPMPAAPAAQAAAPTKPNNDAFNPSNGGSEDDIPF